eukprot:2273878-Rhodomonas_salina.1
MSGADGGHRGRREEGERDDGGRQHLAVAGANPHARKTPLQYHLKHVPETAFLCISFALDFAVFMRTCYPVLTKALLVPGCFGDGARKGPWISRGGSKWRGARAHGAAGVEAAVGGGGLQFDGSL